MTDSYLHYDIQHLYECNNTIYDSDDSNAIDLLFHAIHQTAATKSGCVVANGVLTVIYSIRSMCHNKGD